MRSRYSILTVGFTSFVVAATLTGTAAQAQDQEDTVTTRTERTEEEVTSGYLEKESVGFKPQVGTILYTDPADNSQSRAAGGLLVEMNAINTFFKDNEALKGWYVGPVSGVIYSHVGSTDANFFGTNSSIRNEEGSNYLQIPANLKVGYQFQDSEFRLSAHGGVNATYRSVGTSFNFGPSTATPSSVWRFYPNVGADFEIGALVLRPDVTLTPGNDVFTGTVGLNIPIG